MWAIDGCYFLWSPSRENDKRPDESPLNSCMIRLKLNAIRVRRWTRGHVRVNFLWSEVMCQYVSRHLKDGRNNIRGWVERLELSVHFIKLTVTESNRLNIWSQMKICSFFLWKFRIFWKLKKKLTISLYKVWNYSLIIKK